MDWVDSEIILCIPDMYKTTGFRIMQEALRVIHTHHLGNWIWNWIYVYLELVYSVAT